MHDINFAAHIYRLPDDSPGLFDIDLHDTTEKFWF